jgi:hypothetical protein
VIYLVEDQKVTTANYNALDKDTWIGVDSTHSDSVNTGLIRDYDVLNGRRLSEGKEDRPKNKYGDDRLTVASER